MTGFIDVHGHVVLQESMGAAGPACGPELGAHPDGTPWFRVGDWRLDGVAYKESLFMQAKLRLESMDEAGIDLWDTNLVMHRTPGVARATVNISHEVGDIIA